MADTKIPPPQAARLTAETPLLLSVPDAAAMLSLGRTTVYELIASGDLEAISIGRSRRVPHAAVVEFVEQRSVAAARYGRR